MYIFSLKEQKKNKFAGFTYLKEYPSLTCITLLSCMYVTLHYRDPTKHRFVIPFMVEISIHF
jgi:hypothetical protein